MNLYEYIKKDHQKVSELFEQILSLSDPEEQESLYEELMEELLLHADIEGKSFYKELQQNSEAKGDIEHAFEEHEEVETLLKTISQLSAKDDIWLEKVKELKEAVDHHVKFEEEEVFKKAQEILTDKQALGILEEMQMLKKNETALVE